MGQVQVRTERVVRGAADKVYAAIADYTETRPEVLPDNYSEYEVREGGKGEGTTVHWKLQATQKRSRDCLIKVTEPGAHTLVETDANSTLVTTWTVRPEGGDRARIRVETTWSGASGVAGFFEKTFAPLGMRRIYEALLTKLEGKLLA
jgi:Polyketide cyclase / dehydrase and lipid transport